MSDNLLGKPSDNAEPRYTEEKVIIDALVGRLTAEKIEHEPLIVGIDGLPGSGKSTFAGKLADALRAKGKKVAVVHGDEYLYPADERKSPKDTAAEAVERYYSSTLNEELLEDQVLAPIRTQGKLQGRHEVFTLLNEDVPQTREYDIDENTIVIVEGIFLYKRLNSYFDYKILFDIDPKEAIERAFVRHSRVSDKPQREAYEVAERFGRRYIPGITRYQERDEPHNADLILRTTKEGYRVLAAKSKPA